LIERLPSGNERLDQILNGGLLKNSINLIVGVPGSGKTILSQQFAFHNATVEHPALYLSTLSEPIDKILRFGESLKVFDPEAIREGRVIYEDLGQVLGGDGLDHILETVERYLKESYADPEEGMASIRKRQLSSELGRPEDVAGAALYLASDESKFVMASGLVIDGGMTGAK